MTKKIHTVQSSDKVEFDNQVNLLLEMGCELMDGGYQVINNDDGVVYSQVIVLKKNCEVTFYENGQLRFVGNKNKNGILDGLVTWWWENGQKEIEGTFKDGEIDGLTTRWYEDGQKLYERYLKYKDGEFDGFFIYWYKNGQKESEETYKNGKRDGLYTEWYRDGQKKTEYTYKDEELISKECWDEDGNECECDEYWWEDCK
jgi:antitoxin component YwqK of YwqJK toxin-antitoxin module